MIDDEPYNEIENFITSFYWNIESKLEHSKFSKKDINLILVTIKQAIEEAKQA